MFVLPVAGILPVRMSHGLQLDPFCPIVQKAKVLGVPSTFHEHCQRQQLQTANMHICCWRRGMHFSSIILQSISDVKKIWTWNAHVCICETCGVRPKWKTPKAALQNPVSSMGPKLQAPWSVAQQSCHLMYLRFLHSFSPIQYTASAFSLDSFHLQVIR